MDKHSIICDLDNTFLDIKAIKLGLFQSLANNNPDIVNNIAPVYEQVRKPFFSLTKFKEVLEQRFGIEPKFVSSLFKTFPYYKYLFPDALATLTDCQNIGTVYIYTKGDPEVQRPKVESLDLPIFPKGIVPTITLNNETDLSRVEAVNQLLIEPHKPELFLPLINHLQQKSPEQKFHYIEDNLNTIGEVIKYKLPNLNVYWLNRDKKDETAKLDLIDNQSLRIVHSLQEFRDNLKPLIEGARANPEQKG